MAPYRAFEFHSRNAELAAREAVRLGTDRSWIGAGSCLELQRARVRAIESQRA